MVDAKIMLILTSLYCHFWCICIDARWQVHVEDDYVVSSALHNHTVLSTTCSSLYSKRRTSSASLFFSLLPVTSAAQWQQWSCGVGASLTCIGCLAESRQITPPYVALTKQETDTSDPHCTADMPTPLQSLTSQCKVKGRPWLPRGFWQTNQTGKIVTM